jgi:hypothetical protein
MTDAGGAQMSFGKVVSTFATLATFIAAPSGHAQTLDWEIERSFRFFRFASDEAIHRIAFDLLDEAERTPEKIERLLNGGRFWNRDLPAPAERPPHWPAAWKVPAFESVRDIIKALREKEDRSLSDSARDLDRKGWASLLDVDRSASNAGTCWHRGRRVHDNCKNHGDYVQPDFWKVRVFAQGTAPAGTCNWKVEGAAIERAKLPKKKGGAVSAETTGPCAELEIFVPGTVTAGKAEGRARVIRTLGGQPAEATINIRDILIVGMGDSITSGEGNPELGAAFQTSTAADPLFLPRRTREAHWTDRWCHRSVYAWQIRTALHLSLEDRKRSITLLPYGCSGAEITEGLLYTYSGVEFVPPPTTPVGHSAQVGLAYQELCEKYDPPTAFPSPPDREQDDALLDDVVGDTAKILRDARRHVARCRRDGTGTFKRQIDLIFLAIGINDVGFAKWVSGALLADSARDIADGFLPRRAEGGMCDKWCRLTRNHIARLEGRYRALRQILDERLLKAGSIAPDRVLVALYPNAIQDQDGNTCPRGNQGMTVTVFTRSAFDDTRSCAGGIGTFLGATQGRGAVSAIRNPADLETIDRFRREELNRMVEAFAGTGEAAFIRITEHRDQFLKRGFCATKDAASQPLPASLPCWDFRAFNEKLGLFGFPCTSHDCTQKAAESLHIPRLFEEDRPEFQNRWRPFAPDEFHGYRPRTRLFRTPNDVFVLINKSEDNLLDTEPLGPLDLPDRATSGAMHPTAEAHAIIATAAARLARGKLPIPP